MAGLWGSLLPLAIASAIVPVQLVITVLLLRSGHGRVVSLAWLAGLLTVRLDDWSARARYTRRQRRGPARRCGYPTPS